MKNEIKSLERICSKCHTIKQIKEFYTRKVSPDGYGHQCKKCVVLYSKIWKRKNRERNKVLTRKNRIENKEREILNRARQRAKKNGLDFNLELSDIIIPEFCPVLGIKLERLNTKLEDSSPSIDRLDNSKGYIKENIMIISARANRIKADANLKELKSIVSYIENNS